jgi:hypothetical protein
LSVARLIATLLVLSVLGSMPVPLTRATSRRMKTPRLTSTAPLAGLDPVTLGCAASGTALPAVDSVAVSALSALAESDSSRRSSSDSTHARVTVL